MSVAEVSNILATASIAKDKTDTAGVLPMVMEMTSAMVVAIQTGTASACGVCVCDQARKKQRGDNPYFINTTGNGIRYLGDYRDFASVWWFRDDYDIESRVKKAGWRFA